MGEESEADKTKRLKRVRVLGGKHKVDLFNGSGEHCMGVCEYHRSSNIVPEARIKCDGKCHLAQVHDGTCCCGYPECKKQRLNDLSWLEVFLLKLGIKMS